MGGLLRLLPGCGRATGGEARGGDLAGRLGHRQREGDLGALAGAAARRPDAPAMGLHQPLADRQAEAGRSERALAIAAAETGMLAEQVRQPLRRHAPARVGDRDGDVDAVAHRGDPDGRRLRGVPRGVGEQVVQHLDDAPPVGHRTRQVRRQVDQHAVPAAAAQEGVPGPLHQARDRRRFGGYRERPRVDAPDIEQVADQPAHVIGLLVDDAEELAHLGRGRAPAWRSAR